ncbi:carbonate dehydratase [Streptomyces malaysiensis subsp. malaysiensis]|nr:carbonate dehydratase [Streptomyces malaysiensis]
MLKLLDRIRQVSRLRPGDLSAPAALFLFLFAIPLSLGIASTSLGVASTGGAPLQAGLMATATVLTVAFLPVLRRLSGRGRAAADGLTADGRVAADGRAARRIAEAGGGRACRPWMPWRDHHCTRPAPAAAGVGAGADADGHAGGQLLGGVSAFQRHTAPVVRDELARLAREGQRPGQLFLTCADSRLVTSMITSSGPGDLFTVRNVGNLVPPPGTDGSCDSVGAAIEYAVEVLKVSSITVCGHSGCGAMQALLDSSAPVRGPSQPGASTNRERTPLERWLRHGRPALARMERIGRLGRGEVALSSRAVADDAERLALVNVRQQLDHLMEHACVARRVAEGGLVLHGMYFHVAEAQAYVLDTGSGRFLPIRPDHGPPVPVCLATAAPAQAGSGDSGITERGGDPLQGAFEPGR